MYTVRPLEIKRMKARNAKYTTRICRNILIAPLSVRLCVKATDKSCVLLVAQNPLNKAQKRHCKEQLYLVGKTDRAQ